METNFVADIFSEIGDLIIENRQLKEDKKRLQADYDGAWSDNEKLRKENIRLRLVMERGESWLQYIQASGNIIEGFLGLKEDLDYALKENK